MIPIYYTCNYNQRRDEFAISPKKETNTNTIPLRSKQFPYQLDFSK